LKKKNTSFDIGKVQCFWFQISLYGLIQNLAEARVALLQKCQKLMEGRLKVVICDDDVKVAFARTKPDYY
jgi:hypothetical protein